MKLSPASLAQWCLKNLDLDVWMSQQTLERRLVGLHGHRFTAAGLLGALKRAGWVEAHPTNPGIYCLPARCWLREKQKTGPQWIEGRPFSQ